MGIDVERFEEDVEEGFICPLCSKVLESPVTVTCRHTFCSPCAQSAQKRGIDCPKCSAELTGEFKKVSSDLVDKLGKLAIRCEHYSSGCEAVVPFEKLPEHSAKDCVFRLVRCENKGCKAECPHRDLESHMEKCDYRLVECKVCKICLPRKDMPAHQAIKRCFEQLNKRRMVTSARRLSQELKDHRVEMLHQRHMTDQEERRMVREHYSKDFVPPQRRRAMSAGPILFRSSIQARVGSAMVVPHYSRNLKSATLDSCRQCSNKFLSGRRPSAQRHTHSKPCDHCGNWRRWNGPRGWTSTLN